MVMTVRTAWSASVPCGGEPKNSRASGISAVSSSRLPSSWASESGEPCRWETMSSKVDVSSAGTVRTACRRAVAVDASRATCGGTSIEQMSWTSMRRSARALETAMPYSWSPAVPAGKCDRLRRGDERVRGERALARAGEVEHPRVGAQLGHLAQTGQRSGRVEQRHLDAAPGGQVAECAEQGGLATAGLGHEDGQTGALPHLHGEVQVEEDRAAGRAGRPSDEVAAPVAHSGRGLGERGGEQLHRHPAQVAGVGQGLARDELPGQGLLALRVLQRDPQLALVELDDPAGSFQALLPGRPRDRQPVPAVHAGGVDRQPGGHLVAEHERPLGEPLQLGRRVHAVLGVVELLGADHPQPVLQVAEGVARPEHVDPGRDLDRPRQPLVEVQPRLVPLRDLQRLHAAHGEHGDVLLLAGEAVHQAGRRAVGERKRSICSVSASRSPWAQPPWAEPERAPGGAMPSATDR